MKESSKRRKFFLSAGRALGGGSLMAATLALTHLLTDARRPEAAEYRGGLGILRPPGSVDEDEFLSRCIRCTRCADACQPEAIQFVPSGFGSAAGTPVIFPAETGCNLCLACGDACPTDAILPLLAKEEARMGVAVVDERLCVSHNGTGVCGACHTICPLKNRAISQDYRNAPTVHEDACVGCGLCEEVCIVDDRKAIRIVTARGSEGDHR